MRELIVNLGERSYPIYIGEGLLNDAAAYSRRMAFPRNQPSLSLQMTM